MKQHALFRIAMLVMVSSAAVAFASVPRLINYQGILTDAAGVVLEGTHNLTFRIYEDSTATTAAWTEVHPAVSMSKGIFSVILGGLTPIADEVFAGSSCWLGIAIDASQETAPRMRLTSVPWAIRSAVADSARVAGSGSGGESLWSSTGEDIYRLSGKVGIGTSTPTEELHIKSASTSTATVLLQRGDNPSETYTYLGDSGTAGYLRKRAETGAPYIDFDALAIDGTSNATFRFFRNTNTTGAKRLQLLRGNNTTTVDAEIGVDGQKSFFQRNGGNFGIGTSSPLDRLHVAGGAIFDSTLTLNLANTNPYGSGTYANLEGGWYISRVAGLYGINQLNIKNTSTNPSSLMYLRFGPKVVIDGALTVSGRASVEELYLTGGADIAEYFSMSENASPPPGSVVSIDASHHNTLRLSSTPYDRAVAGIVCGAGNVSPGLTLSHSQAFDGNVRIALTGRVYALATTVNGAIVPGDLLTTSHIPGHAMKASNDNTCRGAVIGKALSALQHGTGEVLVLVQPQ